MAHKRDENTSRVWRKVPENSWVRSLDGKQERKTSWCNCCQSHKPINEFYLKSESKSTGADDVEGACIECYDERVKQQENRSEKRRQREQRKVDESLSTVFSFMEFNYE